MKQTFFDLSARDSKGGLIEFSDYRGKMVLVVNTASKCGFTPQYEGLEDLYRRYRDKGLVIFGFPCDQFAHQEPGTDDEIARFCSLNYGVSFPIMAKINVNGRKTHPVFELLKRRASGKLGKRISWNFTKFLVSPDGGTVKRFAPTVEPVSLENEIREQLGL